MNNTNLHKLNNHKIYYNEREINKNDGLFIYVFENIEHSIEIKTEHNSFNILNCKIKLNKNTKILISAFYKCFNMSEEALIQTLKKITTNSKVKNHFIIGDFNTNILKKMIWLMNWLIICIFLVIIHFLIVLLDLMKMEAHVLTICLSKQI